MSSEKRGISLIDAVCSFFYSLGLYETLLLYEGIGI